MSSIFETLVNGVIEKDDIHKALSNDLERFTKPVLDPDDYDITPKMAGILAAISSTWRAHMPGGLMERYDALCQEMLADWENIAPKTSTKQWYKQVMEHSFEAGTTPPNHDIW